MQKLNPEQIEDLVGSYNTPHFKQLDSLVYVLCAAVPATLAFTCCLPLKGFEP